MKHNIIAIGERTVSGVYGSIWAAGEIKANEAEITKIMCAGEFYADKTSVKKMNIAGQANFKNSKIKNLKIVGELACKGICLAEKIRIYGNIDAESLEVRFLTHTLKEKWNKSGNFPVWSGSIKAENFINFTQHELRYNYGYKNIVSTNTLTADGEISCEKIWLLGDFRANSVNADYIFILPHSSSVSESIMGSKITVRKNFSPDGHFKAVAEENKIQACSCDGTLKTGVIEGDEIYIENVEAAYVRGDSVVVGEGCKIGRIEYKNKIKTHKDAEIGGIDRI